jgi:hypothetical protein
MNSLINTTKQIGFFTIALTLALVANFAYGQWANPTAAPTGDNIEAPINTSSSNQIKPGNIGVNELLAGFRVRSDQYCDFDGNNCFRPCEVSGSCVSQGTWQTGSWSGCSGACGTTGTQSRSVSCPSSAGCSGSRPASSQSCTNSECAVTFQSCPVRYMRHSMVPTSIHGAVVTVQGNSSWSDGMYQCQDGTWTTLIAPIQDRR